MPDDLPKACDVGSKKALVERLSCGLSQHRLLLDDTRPVESLPDCGNVGFSFSNTASERWRTVIGRICPPTSGLSNRHLRRNVVIGLSAKAPSSGGRKRFVPHTAERSRANDNPLMSASKAPDPWSRDC